jgi:type IV pilus assembly protein PilC
MKWWPVLAVLVVAAVVGWWWSLRSRRVKHYRDKLVLRLPGIGGIIQYSILERFCRILSTMSRAGVALPDAMDVVAQSTSNTVFRDRIETARHAMVRGEGLARPLIETQLFPGAARQMIKVGEESGTLDEQLGNAALYFDRELDVRIRRFTNAFEPATIIVVGLGVGFVAIALVQAMYGMLDGFEQ